MKLMRSVLDKNFFFWYNLHAPPSITESLPVYEREYYIQKFYEQKTKEKEAHDSEMRKAKSRSK